MVEKRKFHSVLSSTAVKLSVYSSFLDFGLALSVLLLQKKLLPAAETGFLLNLFDTAITYLTFAIVGLFLAAMILRLKERIITITPHKVDTKVVNIKKLKVYTPSKDFKSENNKTAILRINPIDASNLEVQRVVNENKQNFIKFNGIWYRVNNEKFEKVARPEY